MTFCIDSERVQDDWNMHHHRLKDLTRVTEAFQVSY